MPSLYYNDSCFSIDMKLLLRDNPGIGTKNIEVYLMSTAYETYLINIKRARNCITLYDAVTGNRGSGRRDTLSTDILRAGVVFLHSTLEDYLRTVILKLFMKLITTLNTAQVIIKQSQLMLGNLMHG